MLLAAGLLWAFKAGDITPVSSAAPATDTPSDAGSAPNNPFGMGAPSGPTGPGSGPPSAMPGGERGLAALYSSMGRSEGGDLPPRGFTLATSPALPQYRVTEIAKGLTTGEKFDAIRMNHSGEVLGTISIAGPPDEILTDAAGNRRIKHVAEHTMAAVWQNGSYRRLPVPTGFYAVTAGAMNDSGEVAAISMIYRKARPAYTRIVLYDRQSHLTDIGTLDPRFDDPNTNDTHRMRGVFQGAICLNDRGTLTALVDEKAMVRHADGSILTVGSGIILDTNDRDAAVGFSNEMITSAVMWPSISGSQKPAATPLLPKALATATSASDGRLSLTQSVAECLNDDQKAIIAVSTQMSSNTRQLGHITYYLSDNGKLRLIASMRGVQHDHIRINNAGDAVGFEDFDTEQRAFVPILFHRGKLYDLRQVVNTDGWTITGARDINDKGQILVYGYHGNTSDPEPAQTVPLLLTPQ